MANEIDIKMCIQSYEGPTIVDLLDALGYDNVQECLTAICKEKGVWKKEWD